MNKTVFDKSNGHILSNQTYASEDAFFLNQRDDVGYVDGTFDRGEYYILNGQPTERPAAPVTRTDLTLQGVPAGSTLTIASASLSTSNGERYENVEGDVELEFPLPGSYSLRVECWPYKDWEGEVVVP
jgi:hypothetical protein